MCGSTIPCHPGSVAVLDSDALQGGDIGSVTGVWEHFDVAPGDSSGLSAKIAALEQELAKEKTLSADLVKRLEVAQANLNALPVNTFPLKPPADAGPAKPATPAVPASPEKHKKPKG